MTKVVRIEVDEEVWKKIRAKVALEDKPIKKYTDEIFKKEAQKIEI